MSVRQGLLALLAEQPMHTYQLRQQFEARTGGTWPLNIGQVYTTLQRLVRDGLVEPAPDDDPEAADGCADGGVSGAGAGQAGDRGAPERFRLTGAGRAEVAAWWTTPVNRGEPARDELVIKLALAVTVPGVDVRDVVLRQRTATMRAMHEYTRLERDCAADDLAWSLVLDNLVFAAEAEIRWLDHVEARVSRAARTARDERSAAGATSGGAATKATTGTTGATVTRGPVERGTR
ncbi:MAG TPA: PadR family transcriptional regulator [Cellulomonas sp.]